MKLERAQEIAARHFRDADAIILNGWDVELLGIAAQLGKPILAIGRETSDEQPYGRPNTYGGRVTYAFVRGVEVLKALAEFLGRCNEATVVAYTYSDEYADTRREIEVALNRHQVAILTLVNLGRQVEENAIRNLALVDSRGVKDYEGAYRGVPAIVCGAGPSLSPALPSIKAAQGKAVIVAVDRALKPLLAAGIDPDFVVSLDMMPLTVDMYRGLDLSGTTLVYDQDVYPGVPELFPAERRITYDTPTPLNAWAGFFLNPRGELERSLSVGHSAYFFGSLLGCSPILLSGIDNAFTDKTHAEGVSDVDGGKVEALDPNLWKLVEIEGVQGRPVKTDTIFASFVPCWELAIAHRGDRVINTSRTGARIRGTEERPIEEVVAEFVPHNLILEPRPEGRYNAEAFKIATDQTLRALEAVEEASVGGLRLVEKRKIERAVAARKALVEGEAYNLARILLHRMLAKTEHELRVLYLKSRRPGADREALSVEQLRLVFTGYRDAARLFSKTLRGVCYELKAERMVGFVRRSYA